MKELRELAAGWRVQSADEMTSDPGYASALERCADDLDAALTRLGDDVVGRLFDLGNGQPS